ERLFPLVPVGTAGEFVYQPVKVGTRAGAVYVEVHRDIHGYAPALYREASVALERARLGARADRDRLLAALEDLSGVPMRISPEPDEPAPASAQAVPVAPTEVSHDGAPHPDKEQAGNDRPDSARGADRRARRGLRRSLIGLHAARRLGDRGERQEG